MKPNVLCVLTGLCHRSLLNPQLHLKFISRESRLRICPQFTNFRYVTSNIANFRCDKPLVDTDPKFKTILFALVFQVAQISNHEQTSPHTHLLLKQFFLDPFWTVQRSSHPLLFTILNIWIFYSTIGHEIFLMLSTINNTSYFRAL